MSNELEKDMDDEVYEDSFYENGEELVEDDSPKEEKSVESEDDTSETRIPISFACEDCDYRWDDVIIQTEDGDDEDVAAVCPMCGSENVSQI